MNDQLFIEDFQYLLSRATSKHIKVICPFCKDRRSNKTDRALSINTIDKTYRCHYCEAKGILRSRSEMNNNYIPTERFFKSKPKEYKKPDKVIDKEKSIYPSAILDYFNERGISEATLRKASVTHEIEYFPQLKSRSHCIAFNYMKKGELINTKFRTRNKDFKLISGAELILYNIDSIHPDSYKKEEEKYAIICEGEIDALSFMEVGFEHVVSVPNGANANLSYFDDYIEEYIDHLEYIYIASDNDKKGLELRHELMRRFGNDKCRIIDYPEPCKDANEVLMSYGKDKLIECFNEFTEIKPSGIQELFDVESRLDYLFHNGFKAGDKIGVKGFDEVLSFKVGLLYVVTGVPSHGKTYALNYILSKLNIIHDWKIAFFSPEFYPTEDHVGQIMETLGGKRFNSNNYSPMEYQTMKEYVCKNFFWLDPDNTDINDVMERAKYLVKRRGIKAIVIDPFNALTDKTKGNQKKDEYISDFLQSLRWFARKYGIAVFLVMHPTKQEKLLNGLYPVCDLYACKGASEIYDKADIGITVWRNKDEDYAEIHATKVKFRHLGKIGYSTFKFNINNGRYVEIDDAETIRKQGMMVKNLPIDWDNSNYILDKIKKQNVQMNIDVSYSDNFEVNNSYNNSSFNLYLGDVEPVNPYAGVVIPVNPFLDVNGGDETEVPF